MKQVPAGLQMLSKLHMFLIVAEDLIFILLIFQGESLGELVEQDQKMYVLIGELMG